MIAVRMALTGAALRLVLPVSLLAVWWRASRESESLYFPPLAAIVIAFGDLWREGIVLEHVAPSVSRVVIGYAVASIVGVTLGIAVGLSRRLRETIEPVLEFARALPPPALVPAVILLLGIGGSAKVVVIISGAIWPVLLNTIVGVRSVDGVLRETAKIYGISGLTAVRALVLPGASPYIVAGMRQSVPIAVILMVVSEMFASTNGIGFAIIQFQRTFAIPEMWAGMVMLGLLGVTLSLAFALFERKALSWYYGLRRARSRS